MSSPYSVLAAKVRTKFPGQYDDLSDDDLGQKVIAKHPEYQDLVGPAAPQTPGASDITGIRAVPKPTSNREAVERWFGNVDEDIRHGTTTTLPGRVLHRMGAEGTSSGNSEAVGEVMGSMPLGAARVGKGAAELTQSGKRKQGAKDMVGGALQASTLPASIMGPEGAGTAASAARAALPNVRSAGAKFNEVMAAVGTHPVEITDGLSKSATRYQQLVDAGGSPARAVNKLIQRVTDPDKGALSYKEARDFYSNLTRLSADEMQRLTPVMRKAVGDVTRDLGAAIEDVAARGGKLKKFQSAMAEYRRARKLEEAGETAKAHAVKVLPWAGAAGAAGAAAYGVKRALGSP